MIDSRIRFMPLSVALACALSLAGCAASGHKLDPQAVSHIERGKTTRAEVEAAVGAPVSTSIMPDGKRLAIYVYTESQMNPSLLIPGVALFWTQSSGRQQNLQVIYGPGGVVEDYEFSDQTSVTTDVLGSARQTTTRTREAP